MGKGHKCNDCGKDLILNEEYDAYYCAKCDFWTENKCKSDECEYCSDRPLFPSDIENKIGV